MSWKSKGLSDESIKPPSTSNKMLNPLVDYVGTKARAKLNGDWLKQEKLHLILEKIVNVYTVNEIERSVNISSFLTSENCLFGPVKLTKPADIDQCKYSGYGIWFDRKGSFSIGDKIGKKYNNFWNRYESFFTYW